MTRTDLQWMQFRRLLLGSVIEVLLNEDVHVTFPTITIEFDDRSRFEVPRFNNYMRFAGALEANLECAVGDQTCADVRVALAQTWHDLLTSIELPVGDKLTNERAHVEVSVAEFDGSGRLRVAFDLIAD